MLVLHVIPSSSGGGAETIVNQLVQRVGGYASEVLYFNRPNNENTLKSSSKEFFLNVSSRNPLAIFKLRAFLVAKLKINNNLIIHAHLTWPLYYVAIASLGLGINLVYTEHSTNNKRRSLSWLRYFERLVYNRYSKVFCISRGVHDSLESWLGSSFKPRLKVIPNGVRLFRCLDRREVCTDNGIRLLSVGSLKKMKGFQTVIKALPLLKGFVSKYTIVGKGSMYSDLQRLVSELGLEEVVELVGWSDDLEPYYQKADIQVIPSYWEGFGLVALEGMSTGLPIIASNVDGLREVLGVELESVCLVDDLHDFIKWSQEIKNMVRQLPKKSYDWSQISRKQAEKFEIDKMLDSYKEQYHTLNERL